jgi:hypothetical protein
MNLESILDVIRSILEVMKKYFVWKASMEKDSKFDY